MPGQIIYLVGLAGSGKTTVGKRLAKKLAWDFVDTDQLVERKAKASISEIFSTRGETQFRRLESAMLRSLKGSLIVATGGGMVLKASNRAWMKRHGIVVYLAVSPRMIASRLSAEERKKRPLLAGGLKVLSHMAQQRAAYYDQSHIKVRGAGNPEKVTLSVIGRLRKYAPQVLYHKTAR